MPTSDPHFRERALDVNAKRCAVNALAELGILRILYQHQPDRMGQLNDAMLLLIDIRDEVDQ